MRSLTTLLVLVFSLPGLAQEDRTVAKIRAAMQGDVRTAADVARDENRMPVETLTFFGFREDMRVLELVPGGGWYTKLLAPVLRENGELYVAIGTGNVRNNLLTRDGFGHVHVLDIGVTPERNGPFRTSNLEPFEFGVEDVDLAVTFRNMHNFTPAARAHIHTAVFAALKPGGRYGIVDHSRRHMQAMTAETRRRADVVQIIKEVTAAGFEFLDYSDLHYRPDDELRYEVGRKTVTGNTDRFTLLFRKP